MTLADEQLQRYNHKRLCAVKAEYLLMDARQILTFAGATPGPFAAANAQPATTVDGDTPVTLPQQVREDISVLARHQLMGQLCRFWVYLSWIKDLGYDGPDFWRAVAEVEEPTSGAALQQKSIDQTRIRTGVHVVSCLLGDIDTFHALIRTPNLPVRSILDIPRNYITLAELKRLVAVVSARPGGKMIHSSEMKKLMGWTVKEKTHRPQRGAEDTNRLRRIQPPRQARARDVIAAVLSHRPPRKRKPVRALDTPHPRVMKKKKAVIAEVEADQQPNLEPRGGDVIDHCQPLTSKTKQAIVAEDDDEEWTYVPPRRDEYTWLNNEQWALISDICCAPVDVVQYAQISSHLLQELHAPLLKDDVNAHEQCLMLLLHLLLRLRTEFTQVVNEDHINAVAVAMGHQLLDPYPDILLLFYQYLVCLLNFRAQREELVSWVHQAWPPYLLFNFLEMYHEDDRSMPLFSLVLLQHYTKYEQVRDGQDLIVADPFYDDVLKKVGKVYENDSQIRPLLDVIVRPWERWMIAPAIRSSSATPALIFSSVRSGLANAVDEMSLQVRREQEDLFHDTIHWNKAEYFTPSVRGAMVQLLMHKCGEAQYPRDINHHAIHLLDRYCTTQPPSSPIDPSLVAWEEKLWACLSLAVRMQKKWGDRTEHPFDPDQNSIGSCDIKQISKQELVVGTALEWNLCLPATPSFWLNQLIVRTLHSVADNITLTHQLLDARDFARAAQYVDIMILFASHLHYRFIAAVAFCMVYRPLVSQLGDGLTSITGYTADVISTATDTIQAAIRNIHTHHLELDSEQQREERHNDGDYIIDFMRQPRYEMETDLLAFDMGAFIPYDSVGQERAPRTEGIWQRDREYEPVKGKKLLGKGTFGEVFMVTEKGTQQIYAQKQSKHREMACIQLREVAIMKYLTEMATPYVVPLLDVTQDNDTGQVSIIMPLYSCSLADRCLKKRKKVHPLTPAKIRSFSRQLLTGIRHCHAAGIVHRDLKPENILIGTKGVEEELFIADLGLSRSISRTDHLLTHDAFTVNYAAPELLFQYSMYTAAVDMWSVGCIIVDMITGCRLFTSDKEYRLRHDICRALGVSPLDQMVCPRMSNRAPRVPANPRQFLLEKCQRLPDGDRENMADLLLQLLQVDFTKRISAADALKHAYFIAA